MAEQVAATPTGVDLTNYVPKTEFEKIQTQANEATKGLESLKSQLLDKDYLDYLEARKAGGQRQVAPQGDLKNVDIKNLDMAGLIQLIDQHSMAAVSRAVAPQMNAMRGQLTDVQAILELDQVRQRYEDFDDFAKDVTSILERTQNDLTIEQAYLMAKAQAPAKEEAPPAKGAAAAVGSRSERPGNVIPLDGETVKTFKDSHSAGMAAVNEVLARHGLSGDTL